ncbi:polysaccharide biosynthesis/export family protein [Dinghuibacter silviterrae]|uniref:polysaccharide biosynthesis/export family protein n=1 Tax=Dinghuibacter silviterrae TaxID=1539049 RepID=UPI001FE2BE90|nr:polysaccharide biosynthesis/export family protein [Dinghuibacter silviterrae]
MVSSCADTRKSVYFNGIRDTVFTNAATAPAQVIQSNDLLSITVTSLSAEATAIFNGGNTPLQANPAMTGISSQIATNGGIMPSGTNTQMTGYLVNQQDSIKFPVLGSIKAGGLTKEQLEQELTHLLEDQKLLTAPIVTVRFLNFRVTVLGEVLRPSTINVTSERISILEALGLAGDLTVYAKRDNVLLIREENGAKIVRRLNLNSPDILTSPYYYLKTNDVIYVEPNKAKIASAGRSQQLLPIFLSALSLLAIIVSYFVFNHK